MFITIYTCMGNFIETLDTSAYEKLQQDVLGHAYGTYNIIMTRYSFKVYFMCRIKYSFHNI